MATTKKTATKKTTPVKSRKAGAKANRQQKPRILAVAYLFVVLSFIFLTLAYVRYT